MASTENVSEFTRALKGFHYFQKTWQPKEAEEMNCFNELDNAFDAYAVKTVANNGGPKISLVLLSTHYRRLPLVQGGLEIPCKITAKLPSTIKTIWLWIDTENLLKVFTVNL